MILRASDGNDAPALLDDHGDDWLSHAELAVRVRETAERMAALHPRPLVFQFAANTIAAATCYLASVEAGGAVALFGATLPPGRADELIARYRPHVVLGHRPADAAYAEAAGLPLPAWLRRAGDAPALHPDLAVLLSTSGSTGSPKLVRLSRAAIAANAAAIVQALSITPTQRSVLNLPIPYSYGLSVLNSHLLAGASVLLTEGGLVTPAFWQRLAAQRVTSMPGVPSVYEMLRRLKAETLFPATLDTLTQAGGKLAEPLIAQFHQTMAARQGRMFVMYGQTEATARMAVLDSAALPAKLGAVGRAIPGGRFEIEGGQIVYHGVNVMMGYAETAEDLALGDLLGGRLETGDLGRMDADGTLWITGRAKRIAKVNGQRLNLDEIEAQLAARFALGAATEADGKLVLLVQTDDRHATAIRRAMAEALALPPGSIAVLCVAHLPLGANGKPDRKALKELVP